MLTPTCRQYTRSLRCCLSEVCIFPLDTAAENLAQTFKQDADFSIQQATAWSSSPLKHPHKIGSLVNNYPKPNVKIGECIMEGLGIYIVWRMA